MTKLLIGLGLLIVFGALFSVLSALRAKLHPEQASGGETPAETKETEHKEERRVLRAVVHCTGGGAAFSQYQYQGIRDCLAASQLPGGGPLKCAYGCLGLGTCETVCPFGAIQIREGVALVEGDRCTACGKCVEACPRHIISLEPYPPKRHVSILCASRAAETVVTEVCANGCVGCSACVEACPKEAITVVEGLARIDYEKCDHCARCASNCPRHLIRVEKAVELPEPEVPREPRQPKPKKERPSKEPKLKKEKAVKPPKEPKPKKEKVEKPTLKVLLPTKVKPAREGEAETEKKEKRELPKLKLEKKHHREPEKPDGGEKRPDKDPEDGPKTSAEAFEAFAQAVAAAGEVLGEEKPAEEPETGASSEEKPE